MPDHHYCKLPHYHIGPCVARTVPDRVGSGCHCYHAPEQHRDNRGTSNWGSCTEALCECPGVGPAAEGHPMRGREG